MVKPQLEDGYTMIANEILEALAKTHIRPDDWRVLIFIIRKTYGYHKKVDYISNSQIVKGVHLHKSTISHSLKRLGRANLITRNGKLIGFQKDYVQWKLKESPTNKKLEEFPTGLEIFPTKVESPRVTQKIKETLTKERETGELLSPEQKELFNILLRCPAIKEVEAYKLPELLTDYPNVNHALEFKKFIEWWPGPKKRKKPWSTLRNWLEKAQGEAIQSLGGKRYDRAAENRQRPKFDVDIIESGEDESESRDIP